MSSRRAGAVDRNLTLERRGLRLVADLTPEIAPAVRLAVIGPSEAGKSTLFKTVASLLGPAPAIQLPEGRVACLTDARLRALLTSQWGDHGLPPAQSAFAIHALIVDHYLYGTYYPRGGAAAIAGAARSVIEEAGGACLVRHPVDRIDVERGRAVGVTVQTRQGERRFRAPVVVSWPVRSPPSTGSCRPLLPDRVDGWRVVVCP